MPTTMRAASAVRTQRSRRARLTARTTCGYRACAPRATRGVGHRLALPSRSELGWRGPSAVGNS
eukprot:7349311-Alexandrium_andersonii.AAC.1